MIPAHVCPTVGPYQQCQRSRKWGPTGRGQSRVHCLLVVWLWQGICLTSMSMKKWWPQILSQGIVLRIKFYNANKRTYLPGDKDYYSVIKNTTNSQNLCSIVYPSMQTYLNEKHRFFPTNRLIHGVLSDTNPIYF